MTKTEQMVADYKRGVSVTKLAHRAGCSPAIMKRRLERAGVELTPYKADTEKRDAQIAKLLDEGLTYKVIAKRVGCGQYSIRKIAKARREESAA